MNTQASILEDISYRGLMHQVSDLEALKQKCKQERVTLYAGFDPTADSLHIGSLLPILTLKRFQEAGHIPIVLVGGGTGLIGDPSGKINERTLNSAQTVEQWSDRIRQQLTQFLNFDENLPNAAKVVNNYDWLAPLNVIEFLRDIGKNFTINYMLAKDSVDSRITKGISFTEFSYMILQAYDFLKLSQTHHCSLQIGGSDQWGNITAGLELISRVTTDQALGLTIPLVTKSDGQKFGKTEGGTIWLDSKKTSPYQFYQFWINTDDQDVIKYLKYFTFLSPEQIQFYENENKVHPEKREAQKILASEVTQLVHGAEALKSAIRITQSFFSGDVQQLSKQEIEDAFKDQSVTIIEDTQQSIVDILVQSGLASSKRQARQDIESGAVVVNGEKINNSEQLVRDMSRIADHYLIIRRGKKNYVLAHVFK
jgi:tyrosyl-tRNA synthetase